MRNPLAVVTRQISNHFGSAKGVADENDILQIECVQDRSNIISESVEIVTAAGVIGTSMTATVEGDATPAAPLDKVNYRDVPPVRAKPPGRHQDYRSAGAPISKVKPSPIARVDHGGPGSGAARFFGCGRRLPLARASNADLRTDRLFMSGC